MRFLVMIYWYGGNYSAMVPDLPGCIAAAKTIKTLKKMMAQAIEMHLEAMLEDGEKIPAPRQSIEFAVDPDEEEAFCTWVEVKIPEPISS